MTIRSADVDLERGSPNAGRRLGLEPVTEPEEQRQPIVDGAELAWSKLAEDASHPPLVDGAQVVDEGVGHLGQSAVPWAQRRVQGTITGSSRHRDDAEQREPLVGHHVGIADHDAGPHTTLLAPDRGIQIEENDGAAIEPHLLASTQPSPGTQRTGVPAFMSTRSAASSSGRPLAHSPNPASANCSLSG